MFYTKGCACHAKVDWNQRCAVTRYQFELIRDYVTVTIVICSET